MKPLIVANWKCNPTTLAKAKKLFYSIKKEGVKNIKKAEVVICPPFIYLAVLSASARGGLAFGSQDCFWKEKGAFTGEISPKMLKDLGCQYVIIGHSERRRYQEERDETINKKIKTALSFNLKPILCVGETGKEKNRGQGLRVLNSQISRGLKGVTDKEARKIVIAYEPVWAIGTGNSCDTKTLLTKSLLIRGLIKKIFNPDVARRIPILYGGSVDSENAESFISEGKMSGLLVGGASLNAKEFSKIVKAVSRA